MVSPCVNDVGSIAWLHPIWLSLKTATVSTLLVFGVGIWAARLRLNLRARRWSLLDSLFMLPLALPPTVTGLFLLLLLGRRSPIGQALASVNMHLIFNWPATVVAAAVVSFPIMYLSLKAAFEQVDHDLLDVARLMGYSELQIVAYVMVPLAWPGVAAGLMLSFVRALGEFGATLMLAGNIPGKTQTAPLAVYFLSENGDLDSALCLAGISLAISASFMIAINWFTRPEPKRG